MNEHDILCDKYQLTHLIGEGGFGEVYGGTDLTLQRPVAVKLLKKEISAHPITAERFLKEAQLTSKLTHPNTLTIYDFGEHKGRLFLVSELLNGESLRDRLLKVGSYSPQAMVELFSPMCSALHEAHLAGVIHRDLKPDNLFIHNSFEEERLILLDFGIAKSMGELHLTQTGQIFGTPHYMAPEQIKESKEVDARADIYSLGVIFYEVLSGVQPFSGDSLFEIFDQHVRGDIPQLAHCVSPELTPFDELLKKMLTKSLNDRIESVSLVAKELRALKERGLPQMSFGTQPDHPRLVKARDQAFITSMTAIHISDHELEDQIHLTRLTPNSTQAGIDLRPSETQRHKENDLLLDETEIIPSAFESSEAKGKAIVTSGTFSFGQNLMRLSTFFALSLALLWSGQQYYGELSEESAPLPSELKPSVSSVETDHVMGRDENEEKEEKEVQAQDESLLEIDSTLDTPPPAPVMIVEDPPTSTDKEESDPQVQTPAKSPTEQKLNEKRASDLLEQAPKTSAREANSPASPQYDHLAIENQVIPRPSELPEIALKDDSPQEQESPKVQNPSHATLEVEEVPRHQHGEANRKSKREKAGDSTQRSKSVTSKNARSSVSASKTAKSGVSASKTSKSGVSASKIPKSPNSKPLNSVSSSRAANKTSPLPQSKVKRGQTKTSQAKKPKFSIKLSPATLKVKTKAEVKFSLESADVSSESLKVSVSPSKLGKFKKKAPKLLKKGTLIIGHIKWKSSGRGVVEVCLHHSCQRLKIEIK